MGIFHEQNMDSITDGLLENFSNITYIYIDTYVNYI